MARRSRRSARGERRGTAGSCRRRRAPPRSGVAVDDLQSVAGGRCFRRVGGRGALASAAGSSGVMSCLNGSSLDERRGQTSSCPSRAAGARSPSARYVGADVADVVGEHRRRCGVGADVPGVAASASRVGPSPRSRRWFGWIGFIVFGTSYAPRRAVRRTRPRWRSSSASRPWPPAGRRLPRHQLGAPRGRRSRAEGASSWSAARRRRPSRLARPAGS